MNASPSQSSSRFLLFVSFLLLLLLLLVLVLELPVTSISAPMAGEHAKLPLAEPEAEAEAEAEEAEEASVQIVYVDRPEGADPEEFHIRTLGSVLGSEEAAKEAVIYHYTHAASGFSAKLTPKQVEELKRQPGVLQVVPSRTYKLHGPSSTATQRISIL